MSERRAGKALKDSLYAEFARVAKALASPRRIELVDLLAQGERTVEALATQLGLTIQATSHHLQALRRTRLVEARKEGVFVHYRLAGDDVFELARMIRSLAERRLGDVQKLVDSFLGRRDALEPISREELLRRAKTGAVIILDVRPEEEYRAGHVPGAISIPVKELARRCAELPREKEIVAYCRGPYCLMAFDAVRVLRKHGHAARRLDEGLPEWRAAGLPIEKFPHAAGSGHHDRGGRCR